MVYIPKVKLPIYTIFSVYFLESLFFQNFYFQSIYT